MQFIVYNSLEESPFKENDMPKKKQALTGLGAQRLNENKRILPPIAFDKVHYELIKDAADRQLVPLAQFVRNAAIAAAMASLPKPEQK